MFIIYHTVNNGWECKDPFLKGFTALCRRQLINQYYKSVSPLSPVRKTDGQHITVAQAKCCLQLNKIQEDFLREEITKGIKFYNTG